VKWTGRLSETGTVQVAGLAATMGIQNTSFTAYATASLGTNNVQVKATDYSNPTNTYELVVTNNGLAKTLSHDANGNLTNAGNGDIMHPTSGIRKVIGIIIRIHSGIVSG
jgi:hypothetical protein